MNVMKHSVFLRDTINILNAQMPTPKMYGWFHVMFLVLTAVVCTALCKNHKEVDELFVRRMLLYFGVLVLALEIYKQFSFTFRWDGSQIVADYQWYAFPFQFCSTPMYISVLAAVTKNPKLHKSLCAYLASYAVFAGCCVMVYPGDVFVEAIGINIQTMVCHSTMVIVGVYFLMTGYVETTYKTVLRAFPVFIFCVGLAATLNEAAYLSGLLMRETFNMFFISPHCKPSLPVYSLVQNVLPYPWSLLVYVVMFSVAAYLVLFIAKGFKETRARANSYESQCS